MDVLTAEAIMLIVMLHHTSGHMAHMCQGIYICIILGYLLSPNILRGYSGPGAHMSYFWSRFRSHAVTF